jgi:hypothetical protein
VTPGILCTGGTVGVTPTGVVFQGLVLVILFAAPGPFQVGCFWQRRNLNTVDTVGFNVERGGLVFLVPMVLVGL